MTSPTNRRAARTYRFGRRLFFRAVWAAIAFSVGFGLVVTKREEIFTFLIAPAEGRLSPHRDGLPVILGLADGFMAVIWLGIRVGTVFGVPIFLIGVLHLIKPWFESKKALYWTTVVLLITSSVSAIAASVFVYNVIIPVAITWLLKFTKGIAHATITLDYYVSLLTTLILAMTVVFQLPPTMFLLTKLGAVKYRHWKKIRLPVYGSAFVFSALVSPGFDLSTAIAVLLPFVVMFEIGMFLAWAVRPEDGNYLWLKVIRYRVGSPYTAIRRWILKHTGW